MRALGDVVSWLLALILFLLAIAFYGASPAMTLFALAGAGVGRALNKKPTGKGGLPASITG